MDYLDDELKKLKALLDEISTGIARNIMYELMTAKSQKEVDRVVKENYDFIEAHPELMTNVFDARFRIDAVNKEKIITWSNKLN